jgi:hypothetical protein
MAAFHMGIKTYLNFYIFISLIIFDYLHILYARPVNI